MSYHACTETDYALRQIFKCQHFNIVFLFCLRLIKM